MSKPASFIIPAGLIFEQGDDGLSIEHEGDVILHSTLGLPLKRVRSSGGDIELHVDADNLSELTASGSVRVHGAVTATRINANQIEIHGDATVDTIEAGSGGIAIEGSATAHEISSGGGISVSGGAAADTLSASGDVSIGGDANIDFLSTESGSISAASLTAKAIASGGGISVSGDLSTEEATAAAGALSVSGTVSAKLLRGQTVTLTGEQVTVSAVQGTTSISVGASQIRSDILIAPTINLDSGATGKVTVLESHSEPGPSSVKGCLSLSDLEEFGVDTSSYLSDRKLSALGEAGADADEDSAEDEDAEDDGEPDDSDEDGSGEPEDPDEEPTALESAPTLEEEDDEAIEIELADEGEELAVASVEESDEDVEADSGTFDIVAEDDEDISVEAVDDDDNALVELSPLEDEDEVSIAEVFDLAVEDALPEGDDSDPLYTQLKDTIGQIESCYEGSELPPAVTQLGQLADARNYVAIRDDITNIWHQLLKFHQKRGLRIQPQVTTTFNTINTLVRKI